jgi:hypothetical protein
LFDASWKALAQYFGSLVSKKTNWDRSTAVWPFRICSVAVEVMFISSQPKSHWDRSTAFWPFHMLSSCVIKIVWCLLEVIFILSSSPYTHYLCSLVSHHDTQCKKKQPWCKKEWLRQIHCCLTFSCAQYPSYKNYFMPLGNLMVSLCKCCIKYLFWNS